jgi:hypothetical protein
MDERGLSLHLNGVHPNWVAEFFLKEHRLRQVVADPKNPRGFDPSQ